MGLNWKDVISERTCSRRRPSRWAKLVTPGRITGGGASLAVAAVVLWYAFGGRGTTTVAAGPLASGSRAARLEAGKPADGAAAPGEPVVLARPRAKIDLYPKETRLTGVELIERGNLEDAEKWLLNYLSAPDGREDQALYALGMLYKESDRPVEAEDVLARLVDVRRDSLRAGDALFELGLLREESGRPDEARDAFREAVTIYARSHGGMLAARTLADELYERHVDGRNGGSTKRSEWERVRNLYSVALEGLDGDTGARAEVVTRLDRLNEWVVFTPYSRPKPGYVSTVAFHEVKPRDTLGLIAKRYGVTIGAVRRLNAIPPGRTIIRPGEELKILRGRCEILVKLSEFRLTARVGGCFFREYRVGIGREGRTPTGAFKIATRVVDPPWYSPDGEVIAFGDERNILGSRWLGFERRGAGRGIGIHGSAFKDDVWQGVGEESSNGCIRMRDPDVEELFDFAAIGTEVTVVE